MDLKNYTKSMVPKSKIWNKAIEYCNKNEAEIIDTSLKDDMTILKGKVKCNFGFVHHPIVALLPGDQQIILASSCDCYESNEDSDICSHCAAVFYKKTGNSLARIIKDPRIRLEVLTGTLQDFDICIVSDKENEYGQREISGKANCNFGFVHRPIISLREEDIVSSYCDCYLYTDSVDMCPHCKALYSLVFKDRKKEQVDKTEEPEQTDTKDSFDMSRVRFDDPETKKALADRIASETVSSKIPVSEDVDEGECIEDQILDNDEAQPEFREYEETPPVKQKFTEHDPESMRILFGNEKKNNFPIVWQPNDTTQLFHTNTGIIGTMGTGKTQFTKSLIAQLASGAEHNFTGCPIGILIFDYKGDYNENDQSFQDATGAKVFKPYHLPFNPFALDRLKKKPQLPLHTASAFTDILTQEFGLGPKQSTALIHCIMDAYEAKGITNDSNTYGYEPPVFNDVYDVYMQNEDIKKNDSLYAAMDRLYRYELFEPDARAAKSLFDMIDGVVVIDLSGYDPSMQNLIVAITLEIFYSQMQNAGPSGKDGKFREIRKMICVDEADTIMSVGFPALKKILKEGREFGVGVILSTQFLKHFASDSENYSKYILTWVVHNVSDLNKRDLEFLFSTAQSGDSSVEILPMIKSLECFHSIVKIGNQEFKHIRDKAFFEYIKDKAEGIPLVTGTYSEEEEDKEEHRYDEEDERPSIRNLSYSFNNTRQDLYPDNDKPEIPIERYRFIFGNNMRTKLLYKRHRRWAGSCFGMVSSSSIFRNQDDDISISYFNEKAKLPLELLLTDKSDKLDMTLHTFIEAMHITQFGERVSARLNDVLSMPVGDCIAELCEAVQNFEKHNTRPFIMSVWKNGRFQGGHAILPFRYEELDSERSRLHIYDPNVPGQVRYCELWKNSEGIYTDWRFFMSNNEEYSSEKGSVAAFVPHEEYKDVWEDRDDSEKKAIFCTDCEDIEIKDEDDKTVMKISGGEMNSMREDVVPIREMDGEETEEHKDFWIKPGNYHIINNDPNKPLSFEFSGENGTIEVETSSKEVLVEINDKENIQKVTIVEEKKPYLVRIANMAKEILIKGMTSTLGTVIGSIAGKLFFQFVGLGSVSEFTINGEDAALEDYLETDSEENARNEENDEDEYINTEESEELLVNKKADDEE